MRDGLSFFKNMTFYTENLFLNVSRLQERQDILHRAGLHMHENKIRQVLCSPSHLFGSRRLPSSRDDIREPPWNATGSPSIKTMYKARSSAKLTNPTETMSARKNIGGITLALPAMVAAQTEKYVGDYGVDSFGLMVINCAVRCFPYI